MGEIGINWQVLLAQIVNFTLLFATIGFLIWLIIKLYRNSKDRTPMDIARARYAKGEISLEEFDRIREELGEGQDKNFH